LIHCAVLLEIQQQRRRKTAYELLLGGLNVCGSRDIADIEPLRDPAALVGVDPYFQVPQLDVGVAGGVLLHNTLESREPGRRSQSVEPVQ
jgi:hypothetical protein